jgi:CheY-like chemotaxis protein
MKLKRKIALIDDDHDDHEIFTGALGVADSSVHCICYDSAEEALQILKGEESALPEFIFLDLNMPRMSGIEFLQQIKLSHLAHLPVIIYSTAILPPDRKKIEELGAFRIFLKPNSEQELVMILRSILSNN